MAGVLFFAAAVALSQGARAQQATEVRWSDDWSRVRLLEVANIAVLTVASIEINTLPVADHAKWSKPILFDVAARKLFKSNNAQTQEIAGTLSDSLYQGMVIAPYVIDNYIVALGVHENADVALQMTLINLQSLGLSGVMSLGAEHGVGRARPYVQDCGPGPNPADKVGFNHCGTPGDFQSFYSGHAAATFTMAGLTCAHHQHLPLYGGGLPDALACFVMVGLASATGVLRLVVDRHWASDVLTGVGVGIVNGYVLPMWLHYGFGHPDKRVSTVMKTSFGYVAPIPQVYPGGGGMGVAGVF
jgi:membrane-associated phospholipid phosphatase